MSNIKNKIRKLKFKLRHDFLALENVVLVGGALACLFFAFQSISAMSRSWELSEKLMAERKALELLEVEVQTAEFENEYYKSEEYQELLARKMLDKKLEGEKMVVLPENSEGAKNKYKQVSATSTEREYSNFEKWMMYLFLRY